MASQDDDDLKLIRASASLLDDLEQSLPRLLWKSRANNRLHQLVRQRDLDYILQLIEPFQPEPQLLDARLKSYLPTIVNAYLSYLQLSSHKPTLVATISLDVAISKLLYTFCKVRGEKVITGFLNNEPRYLDLILTSLEDCANPKTEAKSPWEKSYVLLLWLSHLLLAPFDLASISGPGKPSENLLHLDLPPNLPSLTSRVLAVSMHFISTATKEQDAASKLLVRLISRPDMQRLRLPTLLVSWARKRLESPAPQTAQNLHNYLGPLRFLVGMTVSADSPETSSLIPTIYATGRKLMDDVIFAFLTSSAVTKKLVIKMLRNIALLSLHPASDALSSFFEDSGVLEDTIDYLLQSLGDRDTPVRFAASKALSMIILRLDPALSHEVVQAVLDCMKEDMPASFSEKDFSTVDPLRWHGLTLTLAHALFRRSASPAQLPEIVNALLLALTFEQRGTTGSSIGSNVRDAACFGIWSFSRRYSTAELLSVDASEIRTEDGIPHAGHSAIQLVAVHLLLAACLDPAGNIRRGASAALQELIGRHPDQVSNGISLIQVVDYHAVGLRQRAVIEVAHGASSLDPLYRKALVIALLNWRGIGSPDVASREVAATSIGRLCQDQPLHFVDPIFASLINQLSTSAVLDVEYCHGCLLALAKLVDAQLSYESFRELSMSASNEILCRLASAWQIFEFQQTLYGQYTPRSLRADLFSAVVRAITSLAELSAHLPASFIPSDTAMANVATIITGLVSRSEETILGALPRMVHALTTLHVAQKTASTLLDVKSYTLKLRVDSASTTLHGAGRAIALGAAYPWLESIYQSNPTEVIATLGGIIQSAPDTEWRVVALKSLLLIVESEQQSSEIVEQVVDPLHAGLNDYTITERGDVGSLVRAAAIACVSSLWSRGLLKDNEQVDMLLSEDMIRLALEKLDRVRLQAARCLEMKNAPQDCERTSDVSSIDYFRESFSPLKDLACPAWKREAILKGCSSSAGVGAESLLQSARSALVETTCDCDVGAQTAMLESLTTLLKSAIATVTDSQPLLELLAFLLDVVPSLQAIKTFRWRNLLAFVQKSHFKSNNIPKILAAVDVYRSLADIPSVRPEVLKKLVSMLRTNPYPKVRISVAECLYLTTGDDKLKFVDWTRPGQKYE